MNGRRWQALSSPFAFELTSENLFAFAGVWEAWEDGQDHGSSRTPSIAVSQSGKWDSALGFYNGAGNFPLMVFDTGWYTNGGNYENGWNFSNLGSQYNDWYGANTFIYSDQLVWSHDRHNFKFGAEFRAMQINEHPDTGTFNKLNFDPTSTNGNNGGLYNQVGNAFASFLLGDVYDATEEPADPEYGRRKAFAVYASDDIKVTDRLTMNLSLRWDYNNPYKEKYGHWSSFELNDPNPVTGEMGQYEYLTNGSQSFERRQDWFNYSPHIGAAYKLTEKTVVRGNFGVFYTPLNMNTWGGIPYQQTGNPGYYQSSVENNFNWDQGGYKPVLSQVKTPNYTQWGVVSIDAGDRSTEGAPHRQLCDPGRAAVLLLRAKPHENPNHRSSGDVRQSRSFGVRHPPDRSPKRSDVPHGVRVLKRMKRGFVTGATDDA